MCVAPAASAAQWRSLDADDSGGVFFDQGSLRTLAQNLTQATFAIAWKAPDDAVYPTLRIHNVSVVEELWQADCAAGAITLLQRDYFSDSGEHLQQVRAATPTPVVPKPPSQGFELLNLLCGRPQLLGAQIDGGPAELVRTVRERRVEPKPVAPAR
jgi:hypothetical protein